MKRKCLVCEKGILEEVDNIIMELECYIFVAKGHRCSNCNEEFPYEEETKKFIDTSKKLAIWPEPLKLTRTLSKSGRGLVLRIPYDIEKQLNLKESTEINLSKIGNKIIIEPLN
ncbi:hypothetical protein J4230_04380 [Candidatus Woesearchaeota archaeon]|nr:hypothetical protein [Candidatus Woesearchaeota archaeon]